MTKVIGVRFRTAGKIYFFSPGEFEIKQGDHVIVETARGIEYGRVVSAPKEVDDDSVIQPLKSVIRIATEQDEKTVEKNRQKEKEAFKICQEKIRKHGLDMKLIEAEYTFDNNKVLFYRNTSLLLSQLYLQSNLYPLLFRSADSLLHRTAFWLPCTLLHRLLFPISP